MIVSVCVGGNKVCVTEADGSSFVTLALFCDCCNNAHPLKSGKY